MRYKPWGETRYTWTAALSTTPAYALTKYTFTGQYSYMGEFGLMFYNARMYDPALGRFTSADSIIPPGPQGLDRYAYVNNAPVMYVDPSGHVTQPGVIFEGDGPLPMVSYGVYFSGKMSSRYMLSISQAVRDVGKKFAQVRGASESGSAAFQATMGTDNTPLYFMQGNTSNEFLDDGSGFNADGTERNCNISAGACTVGLTTTRNGERVYLIKTVTQSPSLLSAINNMVHELGHLFGSQVAGYDEMKMAIKNTPGIFGRPSTDTEQGFASRFTPWQQSTHDVGSYYEVFADQFLGWTYNTWQASDWGASRSNWMNVNMADWLNMTK